ncbi:MAG: YwiC-like family protein [Polyangiales bacterium]
MSSSAASSTVAPLAPREHGAYGQLGFPLLSALIAGRPTLASSCLVAATVAAFLGHEPLLVLLGQRGARAQREGATLARRRLVACGSLATVFGVLAVGMAQPVARVAMLVPLVAGLLLLPFVLAGREKTLLGELAAVVALTSPGLPTALCSGVALEPALTQSAAWVLGFGAATLGVRAALAERRGTRLDVTLGLVVPPALVALALVASPDPLVGAAVAVMALPAAFVASIRPHPRYLKRVGWTLVAASTLACTLLVVAVR